MKKSDKAAIIISIIAIIISVIAIVISLSGCTASKDLADMTSYSTEGSGGNNVIEWNGVQYYAFGIGVERLMGEQIGIVNGDKNHRVYAVKDYSSDEWIIEKYHTGEMDVAMLWIEKSVESIPVGLEQYKLSPDTRAATAERIIENDGREIIVNSMCGWNFTLTEEKLVRITNKAAEYTGIAVDNDFGRHCGEGIDVHTYDTLPNPVETYLFVFSGDELIYNTKFITEEHFEFVKNLCNEIVQN